MEPTDLLSAIFGIIVLLIAIQIVRLVRADGDLVLMWAERFGSKPDTLKGQVVWVTGASSGIGEHLAYQLAKVGCRLVLSARSTDKLENVKQQCLTYGRLQSSDILILPLNISDTTSHKTATDEVLKTFGQIDILVNNAGRSQRAWVIDTELAVDQEMIQLNVIGQISLTKCVLPHMVERRRGHIVINSSMAGKGGFPFSATYCLTKFAVIGWFSSLAIEMASKNIAVTIICPGPVSSNFSSVAFVGKAGETFGGSQENDANRMSAERCGQLMAIAIANKLDEAWLSRQPALLFSYAFQYTPYFMNKIMKNISFTRLMKLRDGKI